MEADIADVTRIDAATLLSRARVIYDSDGSPLALASRGAWRGGFGAGAEWMDTALRITRGEGVARRAIGPRAREFWVMNALGLAKNGGSALIAAAIGVLVALGTRDLGVGHVGWALGAATFVLAFYAIEGQMVFLFPLALEGRARECRRWTVMAGGTLRVMRTVMPISARMVFGGFIGRGFLRSWCLGCLAVVLWYDAIATAKAQRAA